VEPEEGGDLGGVAQRTGSSSSVGRSEMEEGKSLKKGISMPFSLAAKSQKQARSFFKNL